MFKPSLSLVSFVPSLSLVLATASVLATAGEARAQSVELVGIRAQGMGGAFTAVADDATATWWNPAGLAGGAYLSVALEVEGAQQPVDERDAAGRAQPAWRSTGGGRAGAVPALGVSDFRPR